MSDTAGPNPEITEEVIRMLLAGLEVRGIIGRELSKASLSPLGYRGERACLDARIRSPGGFCVDSSDAGIHADLLSVLHCTIPAYKRQVRNENSGMLVGAQ
jgi:hypothetical protein